MLSRRQARITEIRDYAAARGVAIVGESEFAALRERLAPIGEPALRKLLRETKLPLTPVVEGVQQEDFESLERTLTALAAEYELARGARTRILRRLVITAKEHARLAAKSAKGEAKRRAKEEMAEWMLVWLENPGVFPQWVKLRRRATAPTQSTPL